jgi:menaquinone-dependent protoporphyrinogen oxidase
VDRYDGFNVKTCFFGERIVPVNQKILVAYATKHGSTQEVAEEIAQTLRNNGLEVDLQPIRKVKALDDYSAVVLGAPIYMFHWHQDALHFLAEFRKEISGGLPVAIFAGGPFGEDYEKEMQEVRARFDGELAKVPWFTPLSVQIVGGKFDPARLRFPYNLIPALKQLPPTDLRNWDEIRAWAISLVGQLHPVTA